MATTEYRVQWHESRVNLAELAKLRYLEGLSRTDLAKHYNKTPMAITNYLQNLRRKNFKVEGLTQKEQERIKWAYQN